ncbi:hypothetical protein [Marinobacter sp.]|uniref:hypothetical protein n=1 Tax=Marinobacter sp. TaxID=50741 RepID=UPI0034A59C2A
MDTDQLLSLMNNNGIAVALSVIAVVVALVALVFVVNSRRTQTHRDDQLRHRTETLWRDMDELRINHFNGPAPPLLASGGAAAEADQFAAEKAAYDVIWPQVWLLHDRLGIFLRAVESGDGAGDLRLEARNAALEARTALNRNRPFCHEEVEALVTKVIDTEIKAHLAACQYMDLLKDPAASNPTHDRNIQREKFHLLYDSEAREMINQLVNTIRGRTLRKN